MTLIPMTKHRVLLAVLSAGVVAGLLWVQQHRARRTETKQVISTPASPQANALSRATTPALTNGAASLVGSKNALRPLPVASENSHFQWTAADGKDPNVIRQLAHNELEYQRMVEENARIKRRQLVYNKNIAAAVMERSRLTGEKIEQLTLPGFDGAQFQFIIERADLEPSKQSGTFTGRIEGQPESLVTLAFKFGREAFTILSPETGTFIQAFPREPGEIMLTSFDPATYQRLPGGEPIKTSQ